MTVDQLPELSCNTEPDEIPTETKDNDSSDSPDTSFEDFLLLLARRQRNVRLLKRIPRGARVSPANRLSQIIEECLSHPQSDKNWIDLLTFAYTSLQVPDRSANVSLDTLVKRNIEKPTLKFKKRSTNKVSISISRMVEYTIADGDVKGAVKILSSSETLAPENMSTLNQLRQKHSQPKRKLKLPEAPADKADHLIVTEKAVVKKINNFPMQTFSGQQKYGTQV